MLSDPQTRPLLLKSILGEARPAGANDPPAEDVSAGTFGDNTGGGQYIFLANGATTTPLTVKGAASQSVPLQNWKNSAGDVLAAVQGDGNVGIGLSAPAKKLHVQGDIQVGADWAPNPWFLTFITAGADKTSGIRFGTEAAPGLKWSLYGSSSDSSLHIKMGDTERLTIDSAGKLGIGVTNPGAPLHVRKDQNGETDLILGNSNTSVLGSPNTGLVFSAYRDVDPDHPVAKIVAIPSYDPGSNQGTTATYADLAFHTTTSFDVLSEKMRITKAGNVGIGTAGPETPLMVVRANSGSGALTPVLKVQTDGASGEGPMVKFAATLAQNVAKGFIAYQSTGGGYGGNGKLLLGVNPAADATDVSASDAKVAIQGDGKVGIGTATPGARLDVNGEVSAPVIKETATEYSGTDITDHSPRKVFFNVPGAGNNVLTYYKIARVKILGTYSNVHFYGWLDSGGSHIGLERRMEVEVRAFTMGDATQSTLVYSKRGQNTEYFCAYKIEDGDGSGHDYYDLYVKQRWWDNTTGEIDIRVGCGTAAVTVWQTGSNCGTGTPDGALQSPNADYTVDKLNEIIFLRPKGGSQDDSDQINNAIAALPASGGIVVLLPGTYNIGTTISNLRGTSAKNGVKLRGYGGGWPGTPADALTRLVWTGPAGGTVIDLKPYDPDPQVTTGQVQDLEVSDLTIDGSSSAGIGLRLDRVFNSRFRRLQIRNMSDVGGVGMKLTTTAFEPAGANMGCQYNSFEDCAVRNASKCVVLTSEPPDEKPVANSCHNTFVGLSTWHYGTEVTDAGILLEDCDNNNFIRTYCWPSVEGSGFGVVIADPRNARANYFYHLQAWPRVRVNKADAPFVEQKNVIFGYDLENTQLQPEAVTSSGNPADPANFLFWIDSAASVNASELAVTEKMSKAAGAVYASANQSSVHGADTGPDRTYFTRDVSVGDNVTIVAAPTDPHPETRTVTAVNSDFLLTVDSSFTYDHGWGLLAVWPCLRLALRVADPWGGTKLSLSNAGNLSVAGSLSIGGAEVVSDQRVLHNVTANAGIITSGAFQPSQIPNLDASKVTSGTFQAVQIPNLNASKINDGIFDLARIPTMDNAHLPGDLLHGKTADGRKIAWGAAHLSSGSASVGTGLSTIEAALVTAINGTSNTFNADHSAGGGALTIGCSDGSSTEWVWWIAIGT